MISDITADSDLDSDHNPIVCTMYGQNYAAPVKPIYNYYNADWTKYKQLIHDKVEYYDLQLDQTNIDNTIELLTNDVLKSRNSAVPLIMYNKTTSSLSPLTRQTIATRNSVRRKWQRCTNPSERNALKHLLAQWNNLVKRYCYDDRNNQWTKSLRNLNTGSNHFWKITKSLNGKKHETIGPLQMNNNVTFTNSGKAEMLANTFERANLLTLNNRSPIEPQVNLFMSAFKNASSPNDGSAYFTNYEEISDTVRHLKPFKAPGPDEVHNILLKQLPVSAILLLVTIFNNCVTLGHWPISFKLAKVVAIPKPNKSKRLPESYRPISLLNAIGKLFEKILLKRILSIADNKNLHRAEQFGFKSNHSTVHQLMRVKNHIVKSKSERKSSGLLMLDFEKAFDTIWHDGLI